MKKIILSLFIFLVITGVGANVQAQQEDVYMKQVTKNLDYKKGITGISQEDLIGIFSRYSFLSDIQQSIIDANQIAIINTQGNLNTAELNQAGINNVGIIKIDGNSNTATLDQQGSGLLSILNILGNANQLDVDQTGYNLQNYIKLSGSGMNFNIMQGQEGVTVTQAGMGGVPLQIKSEGRSIPIIIKNNRR